MPEFEAMKCRPLIVNTARGGLVDEVALVRALDAGLIAGAGFDVVDGEPPKPDNPLMRAAARHNVILTLLHTRVAHPEPGRYWVVDVDRRTAGVIFQSPLDYGAAQWAYDKSLPAGVGTDTLAANPSLYLPLQAPMRTRGVLVIEPDSPRLLLVPEQRRHLDTFAALTATCARRWQRCRGSAKP